MTTASGPEMYADWNRRPSSPATNNDLHRQIMELPVTSYPGKSPARYHGDFRDAYDDGHKEARQAAAKLALRFSPAPVNTQGGGLREALKEIRNRAPIERPTAYLGDDTVVLQQNAYMTAHYDCAEIARAALAQAEQEQPATTIGLPIGLSILDAAEAIQEQSGGCYVELTMRVSLSPGHKRESGKFGVKTRVNAEIETGYNKWIGVCAESLPGVIGEMTLALAKQEQ